MSDVTLAHNVDPASVSVALCFTVTDRKRDRTLSA